MKTLNFIFILTLAWTNVHGHGHFFEPPTRNHVGPSLTVRQRNTQGCNVGWENTYLTGGF